MTSQVLKTLNRLISEGHAGVLAKLIEQRVDCNEKLGADLHIQVLLEESGLQVGFLGILNGILSEHDNGSIIQAVYGEHGELVRFKKCGWEKH